MGCRGQADQSMRQGKTICDDYIWSTTATHSDLDDSQTTRLNLFCRIFRRDYMFQQDSYIYIYVKRFTKLSSQSR